MASAKNEYLLWGIFYLVAHGGILLIPNAVYWDDWILYRANPDIVLDTFRQAGAMFNLSGYLHVYMLSVGPWLYRVLTLIFMFASGMLLNQIIRRHEKIDGETRFLVVLFFLILPFNMARVALINFVSTFDYFLFFLAWWAVDRSRVLALVLFFLSFNVNSLLVFYAIPFFDMYLLEGRKLELRRMLAFFIRKIDFVLLPFIYFFVKLSLFSPRGFYEGYNQNYSIGNLLSTPLMQVSDLLKVDVAVVFGALMSIFAFWLLRSKSLIPVSGGASGWRFVLVGFALFCVGAFPYWILGLPPTFAGWTARHQLLLPLGASIMVAGVFSQRVAFWADARIISVVVGASLAIGLSNYYALFVDWSKQQELISLFANNPSIERARLIVVDDRTTSLNAFERQYSFQEWGGIVEAAYANQKHFVINRVDVSDYLLGKFDRCFAPHCKAGEFRRDESAPQILVKVERVEPRSLREMAVAKVFPSLQLSVSPIDVRRLREVNF